MNIKKTIFLAVICLFVIACKKQQTVSFVVDVRYFSNTIPCAGQGFSEDIKTLYTPFQFAGDTKIGILKGTIRSFDSLQKANVVISDTATNILSNWKKKFFGSKKDFSDVMKKYDEAFGKVNIASLCADEKSKGAAVSFPFFPNTANIKKGYAEVLVYSKKSADSQWNGFKVYHKINELHARITALATGSTGPFLVVYNTTDTSKHDTTKNKPSFTFEAALTELIKDGPSEEAKRQKIDEMMNTYFATNFLVVMHPDDVSAIPRRWEGSGEGIKYLERLTTDTSITGFKIISAYKSKADNKITRLELVEFHNH